MYQAFTVKNFRCFRELFVEPLQRVNLIAGRNNVGKTALLEALFLSYGPNNPELSLRIGLFRGLQSLPPTPDELWGWLFYNRNLSEPVELKVLEENGQAFSLRINLGEPPREISSTLLQNGDIAPKTEGIPSVTNGQKEGHQLILSYVGPEGTTRFSRGSIKIESGSLRITAEQANLPERPTTVFLTTHGRFPIEDAARFSSIRRTREDEKMKDALKFLESRLQRLDLLLYGGIPLIHGDLGFKELVPLAYMGEGMVRLTSILLAIANAKGGAVLVDEIENGFHYSVLPDVWRAIDTASQDYGTQVFATTHSIECIAAAHTAFSANLNYGLALHRLEFANGNSKAITYDKESIETSIKRDMEVR
jgi:hypothetical protein